MKHIEILESRFLKVTICRIICLFIVMVWFMSHLIACESFNQTGADENGKSSNMENVICTFSDFSKIDENWFARDGSLTDEARKAHQSNLVVGEEYFIVTSFDAEVSQESSLFEFNLMYLTYNIRFCINNWSFHAEGRDAVSHSFQFPHSEMDDIRTFGESDGLTTGYISEINEDYSAVNVIYYNNSEDTNQHFRTYVAIPFVPLVEGTLSVYISIAEQSESISLFKSENGSVCANVVGDEPIINAEQSVTVSGFTYDIMTEQVYNWSQDETHDTAYLEGTQKFGLHYIIIEFDLETDAEVDGSIGLALRMPHYNNEIDADIDAVNTNNISITKTSEMILMDMLFSAPQKDRKHVTAVITFDVPEHMVSYEFDVCFYSQDILIQGTTYEHIEHTFQSFGLAPELFE